MNINNHFLFEIGCEELPPNSLGLLSESLKTIVSDVLHQQGILFDEIKTFAAPRRLAILIENLPAEIPAVEGRTSGPPLSMALDSAGNYTQAALGWAKKNSIPIDKIEKDETIQKLVFKTLKPSLKVSDFLPEIIKKAVANLPIPKPMRWGNQSIKFIRPVHWVVMLWNEQVIHTEILGVQTTRMTRGHRVMSKTLETTINHASEYEETLANIGVIADFQKRKNSIKDQLEKAAQLLNASVVAPDDLLNEVTGLVEWPVVLTVTLDEHFLTLPSEVLITAMQQHQKSFALKSVKDHQLIPYFLAVSNIASRSPEAVIHGNQRVMQARLSDALFFYENDQKIALIDRREGTKNVIYQAKLGTLFDKSERLRERMKVLINSAEADRAAQLSQCDLMTDMVNEFPELQGTMGYYYAQKNGESNAIAIALKEQYQPRFSGDDLPETILGIALAIAERVDTLIGAFSLNQKPTGNKDPFKLRRHALSLVRLFIERQQDLDLETLGIIKNSELQEFIIERLKFFYMNEKNISLPVIQAVLANQSMSQSTHLYDFSLRLDALSHFMKQPEVSVLAAANKRVQRILEQANKMNDIHTDINTALLLEPAEKKLAEALLHAQQIIQPLLLKKQYSDVLQHLALLREPIDLFFETVMVNVEDESLRQNRLVLLMILRQLFMGMADFSCLHLPASI